MKYQPKFQKCPYRSSDGKCTHKIPSGRIGKAKRFCGYSKPEKCQYYNEWVESIKSIPAPINHPRNNKGVLM